MTEYVTKDSGARDTYESGLLREVKADKPNFDLLLVRGIPFGEQFLTRMAALMTRGATKYEARNFEKACTREELDEFIASAFRHMVQYASGDRGEDHAAAVSANLIMASSVEWKLRVADELEDIHDEAAARRGLEAFEAGEPVVLWDDVKARLDLDIESDIKVGDWVRDDQNRKGTVVYLWSQDKSADVDMGGYWGTCVNVPLKQLERIR